jgi:hypothetical protein
MSGNGRKKATVIDPKFWTPGTPEGAYELSKSNKKLFEENNNIGPTGTPRVRRLNFTNINNGVPAPAPPANNNEYNPELNQAFIANIEYDPDRNEEPIGHVAEEENSRKRKIPNSIRTPNKPGKKTATERKLGGRRKTRKQKRTRKH